MHKKVEESSIKYSRRVDEAVCVHALQMCAWETSHTALDCLLQRCRASFMLALCLREVLISSPDTWDWTRMQALAVTHRRTLCENVDSAKITEPFYTTDIDILRVTSMHRIDISIHNDESLHPYYPCQAHWLCSVLVLAKTFHLNS